MSEKKPKLRALDEETNRQIVPRRRFGKAHSATHETLDPSAQTDVLAVDFLGVLLADCVRLGIEMPLYFFSSLMTVVGLMCNTRAVSRMLLAFIAISTICCFTSGACPA